MIAVALAAVLAVVMAFRIVASPSSRYLICPTA
jgi:hypothetical protein